MTDRTEEAEYVLDLCHFIIESAVRMSKDVLVKTVLREAIVHIGSYHGDPTMLKEFDDEFKLNFGHVTLSDRAAKAKKRERERMQ